MSEELNIKALKSGIWYVISNFLISGIAFITTPIFTRLLTKYEYGYFSNYSSWAAVLSIVVTLSLYTSVQRAYYEYKNQMKEYLSSVLILGSVFTGLAYMIVLVFKDFLIPLFGLKETHIHIMFLSLFVSPALNLLSIEKRFSLRYKSVTALSFVFSAGSTVLSIALVYLMGDKLLGRILGSTGSVIALNLIIYIYILRKGRSFNWAYCKYALAISLPIVMHLLGGQILSTSDRIMITRICGEEYTALYTVVYTISAILTLLQNSLNLAWVPWLFQNLNDKNYAPIKKYNNAFVLIFCVIVIPILLLAPEVVSVFAAPAYRESCYLMPPIMMGLVCYYLYSIFQSVELYHKKNVGIAVMTLIAALCNILLNALFIPVFGYVAAAYTTLFSYFLLLLLHYWAASKLGIKEYFNIRFIFFTFAVMLATSALILSIYELDVVRYALFAVYILTLFIIATIKRKSIGGVIRMLRNRKPSMERTDTDVK